MDLPDTYTRQNENKCCPMQNVKDWDKKEITFKDRHFIRIYSKIFLFIPLNMANE